MTRECAAAGAVACLLVLWLAGPVRAQTDKVDAYVSSEMAKQSIPGLSLAVVRGGQIVKAKGFGLANLEHHVPATPETIFQSGSMGKQFTPALVMMLVEDGVLSLDDPISKFNPHSPRIWKGITIRHLLTHTAGISNALYDVSRAWSCGTGSLRSRTHAGTGPQAGPSSRTKRERPGGLPRACPFELGESTKPPSTDPAPPP